MHIFELYRLCENLNPYTTFRIIDCGVKICECQYDDYHNRYTLKKITGFRCIEPGIWEIYYNAGY